MISIKLNGSIDTKDVAIKIDNKLIDFELSNGSVVLKSDLSFGFHKLQIVNLSQKKIQIDKVFIDGNNIRKLIYLSWSNLQQQRFQPCTELWETNQSWTLPFVYPLSQWIAVAETKIRNDYYGKDLSEKYFIWYPDSIEIDENFPQVIQDFFQYNFDITVVDKHDHTCHQIPYVKFQGTISNDLLAVATKEILNNLDIIMDHGTGYGQRNENLDEFNLLDENTWRILWLKKRFKENSFLDRFPDTWKLIDSLKMDFWQAFIGLLPPKGFIYPHTDNTTDKDLKNSPYVGCTQLYIPIQWPEKSYVKFANAGIVDMSTGPMLVNTDHFTHSVVNDSDQPRIVLALGLNQKHIIQYQPA